MSRQSSPSSRRDSLASQKSCSEETKKDGQIAGDAADEVEKAITEGNLRKNAQTQADAIIGAGGTLSEQRDKAKQIDDPDLRDKVMQQIEHEADVNDKAKRDADETLVGNAFAAVGKAGSINAISPSDWIALGKHQPELVDYANKLAQGEPVKTDASTLLTLIDQAGTDPDAFAKVNLNAYINKLSTTDLKSVADAQFNIRKGDREAAQKTLAPFTLNEQMVQERLDVVRA